MNKKGDQNKTRQVKILFSTSLKPIRLSLSNGKEILTEEEEEEEREKEREREREREREKGGIHNTQTADFV